MEKPHNGVLEAWYRETVGPNGQYWIKGLSHGHPHYNGQHIHTSRVIAEDGNEIETLNSLYTLSTSVEDTALMAQRQESFDNGLSEAEAERLHLIAEECAEVVQAVTKILRHGYDSHHPKDPLTSNRQLLQKEMGDVLAVFNLAGERKDVDYYEVKDQMALKYASGESCLHHNTFKDLLEAWNNKAV